MSNEELVRLKQYCMSATPRECLIIMRICQEVDLFTADDMYIYLRTEISYDRLINIRYIPASKRSFYERCNKVLEIFRNHLIAVGVWA